MTKDLSKKLGPVTSGVTPIVAPYAADSMGNSLRETEEENLAKTLGLKTTEEKIHDLIKQASNYDSSTNFYDHLGKEEAAKILHEEVQKIDHDPKSNHGNILEILNQVIKLDPKKLWAHYERGLALMKLDRFEEAILDFKKELEINDSQHCQKVCRYEKGWAHYLKRDFAEAKLEFENVLQNQDESGDDIFETAKKNLEEIESFQKADGTNNQEKTKNFSNTLQNRLLMSQLGLLFFGVFILQPLNDYNRRRASEAFYEEDVAEGNTRFFARTMFDNLPYEELADHLAENFHKLPDDFFQRLSKSNATQDLRAFLDEQQFLDEGVRDGLIKIFEDLKKFEQDQLPKPFQFKFPKNFLRDTLLKNSNSQNYPNDPARMSKAIENFEDELSKHFYEICENILKNEKIKPLLAGLVSDIEDLIIAPAKNLSAAIPDKREEMSEYFQESSSIDDLEIPSTNPLNTQAEPKFTQAKLGNNTRKL